MWKPQLNFITLHYAYILLFGILALIVVYPYGNLTAIDAYFFGVSASTESGLNTVDVKALKTYQQIFIYLVPIVTNLGFVNIIVVVVRLHWFRQRFAQIAEKRNSRSRRTSSQKDAGEDFEEDIEVGVEENKGEPANVDPQQDLRNQNEDEKTAELKSEKEPNQQSPARKDREISFPTTLTFEDDADAIIPVPSGNRRERFQSSSRRSISRARSVDRAVQSMFVLGSRDDRAMSRSAEPADLASMTRDELGGIEYRALRTLLPIVTAHFFGLHLFGVICLLPWIHTSNPKYRDYLASQGQDVTWWAFYSAQTMVDNLGFTLTPDSMISFRDATFPMLVMSFLAFAGNTFYPCFLRLSIWLIHKLATRTSSLKESLQFLLDHPRRCYTLLFPSSVTWTLAAVLIALNFVDVLLIIVLDLDNEEVNVLPMGARILAALFQAASSRHTGTATFNLANVNPAVQFSLLVMMYISIYPIAISIRMSNSYEEQAVGIYGNEHNIDEKKGSKLYFFGHLRNQLSFDLWYIFLGVFCITAAEGKRIMDREDYAFSVFSIFFEVVSAYGNVGLSLGYPTNSTSLCGHFTVVGKLVICAMMIRGRHRGMPYALDRAITLPSDRLAQEPMEEEQDLKATDNQ